jgi:Leucine-rich repeat (LRR) protein
MKHLTLTAVSLLLIGLTMSGSAYSQVPAWEREALIAFYNATDGDSWYVRSDRVSDQQAYAAWNGPAGTECDWLGVTCTNGVVTSFQSAGSSLYKKSGFIPPELGNLTNLIGLYLYDNQLTGSIPAELGNLTNLQWLQLEKNQLTGSIPAELGNLTQLTVLNLYNNQLSGSIPAELGNLSSLLHLYLYNNQLSGSIPAELGNLTALTQLFLYGNQLSGSIPAELGNLANLNYLYLDNNQLTGSIPAELGNLPLSVTGTIRLNNNQLSGSIPPELGNLQTSIRRLYLNNNQLTGSIPAELGNLTELYSLYLNNNQLSGGIPSALDGFLTDPWEVFELSNNPKLDRNVLVKLYSSTYALNWTNNTGWIGDPGTECDWYGVTCTGDNVTGLNLASNNLVGTIPSEIGNFTSITSLDLSSNTLTGSIPTELANLTTLTALDLSTNSLTGPLPQWLSDMAISSFNVTDAFNAIPVVAISGGNRTIVDTGDTAGESVSFTGTATDSDGTIATTQWLVDGSEVATGLSATISLSSGSTVVTFKATDNIGDSSTAAVTITITNTVPDVYISGGNRTIADTDGIAGESVSFTGTAVDNDGTIATTQWLVGGSVVATGLSATISLPNRSTVVTFKATDNVGASSTKTVTITVAIPTYTVTDEWPSPYNGVTPDSSLDLAFNNIGIYDAAGSTIYTCLRVYTDGLPGSVGGIGEFDIGLTIVSLDEGTVQITKFREFNVIGALNENVELPDCSGKFETTTAVFTDTIETKLYTNLLGNLLPVVKTFNMTFDLIDGDNLILKLSSYQELTAN